MDEKLENFADAIEEVADEILAIQAAHSGDIPEYVEMYSDHPLYDMDDETLAQFEDYLRAEVNERRTRSASL